jgi:ATP-independent RNA helicase DbpA
LDIDSLDAVINYELSRELESHIHRVGRTGRAGNKGLACTLVSDKEEYRLSKLENLIEQSLSLSPLPSLNILNKPSYQASMTTLLVSGGKKQKLRAGDILGALTGENGIEGRQVGKIKIVDNRSYVAVDRKVKGVALQKISKGKLKGRSFKVRELRD